MVGKFIEYALHPLILICVLTAWLFNMDSPLFYPLALLSVHLLLGVLEHTHPARAEWVIHARPKIFNIVLVCVLVTGAGIVAQLYQVHLVAPLAEIRGSLGLDIWPHSWPMLGQLFLVFFAGEFIWYWIHRAEHRWYFVWRVSGHGAHHSFKKLNALNFGLNHPLELFFLSIPAALMEVIFGVGLAAVGASILLVTQASIVHSNLNMSSKWVDWVFTTNRHHIRHHSVVLEESNTNYGCGTLVWDRVFGTFINSSTRECGVGPTEPTLVQKLFMPVREPSDTTVAPS